MTIITGREFRSNQNKYIGMAHRGERVVISSKSGHAELTLILYELLEGHYNDNKDIDQSGDRNFGSR